MAGSPEQEQSYIQPALAGFEAERSNETLLEHVVIEVLPTCKQQNGGLQWDCQVYCPPDIFNQERNDYYQAHARSYAKDARRLNLRPGDIVTMTGIPYTQEIETGKGDKQTIKHFTVSHIDVLSRAKRTSITVYEKRKLTVRVNVDGVQRFW